MRSFLLLIASLPAFAASASAQTVLFSEDFESGYSNWSMTGLWHGQDASGPCTAAAVPFPSGTHAAWYGSATTCNFSPSDWSNHYLTHLVPIVLPATNGVLEVGFRSHGSAEEDGVWDVREVEVSANAGASWTKIGSTFNRLVGWGTEVFDLTQYAGATIRLRFRFWAGDGWANDGLGWLIDDIQIVERAASAVTTCLGDGSWRSCPCGNDGAIGRGCASSFNPAGAFVNAAGFASVSADSLQFSADGMSPAAATFLQASNAWLSPYENVGGDGWACVRGPYARIRTMPAPGGAATYPLVGEVPISVRGNVTVAGTTRNYFVRYRNAASFCTTSTFNVTNGLSVTWRP